MDSFVKKISRFLAAEDGPTAVEYAMMVLLVFLACLSVITFFGQSAATSLQESNSSLTEALSSGR